MWRHLLESDRLPLSTVSFLLSETLNRLSCDSSFILHPATMTKEVWYSQTCIQCHSCLIIDHLLLCFELSGSRYPDLFVVIIILRCLINSWRYMSVCLGGVTLVIRKPCDARKYFPEFVSAIVSIAFSNDETNCNKNLPFYRYIFVYNYWYIRSFLLHMCAPEVGCGQYAGKMGPFNVTFSQ